jgi:hypothetical protein
VGKTSEDLTTAATIICLVKYLQNYLKQDESVNKSLSKVIIDEKQKSKYFISNIEKQIDNQTVMMDHMREK